jgi:hypothetical protein
LHATRDWFILGDENKNSGSPTTNNSNQPRLTWAGLNTAEKGRDNSL